MGKTKVLSEKNLQEIVYPPVEDVCCLGQDLLSVPPSNQINKLSALAQNGEAWICPEEKE